MGKNSGSELPEWVADGAGGLVWLAGREIEVADSRMGNLARAGQHKRVGAYIEDLGASAAYWIASQAGFVAANESALVGSIGTYGVIYDWSKTAEMEGIKTNVVRSGAGEAWARGWSITQHA